MAIRASTYGPLEASNRRTASLMRLRDAILAGRGRSARDLPVMSSPPTLKAASYRANATAYATGDVALSNNGLFYTATTGGTSGTTFPSGTGSGIADGTVVWAYLNAVPSNYYSTPNAASRDYLWEAGAGARFSAFRALGGNVVNDVTIGFAKQMAATVGGVRAQSAQSWETVADAQRITVRLFALDAVQVARVIVDGQYVSLTPVTLKLGIGALLIEFASRAVRTIEIETSSTVYFGGFDVGLTDTLDQPSGAPLCLAATGDSLTAGAYAGTNNTNPADAFPRIAAQRLGMRSVLNTGIGATGLLVSSASGTARSRVGDLGVVPVHAVFEANGYNDIGSTQGQIQTEEALYLAAIRATVGPDVPIFVLDCFNGNRGATHAATLLIANGKMAAVAAARAAGDRMIFPILGMTNPAGAWTTGTGNTGAVAGNGNADIYIGSDAVHWSLAGANFIAGRVVDAVSKAIDAALLEAA